MIYVMLNLLRVTPKKHLTFSTAMVLVHFSVSISLTVSSGSCSIIALTSGSLGRGGGGGGRGGRGGGGGRGGEGREGRCWLYTTVALYIALIKNTDLWLNTVDYSKAFRTNFFTRL